MLSALTQARSSRSEAVRRDDSGLSNRPGTRRTFLHILHIIASLSPAGGGPPEAVRQLVRAYLEVGAGIEVVCLDPPGATFLSGIPCPVHPLGQSYLGKYALSPRLWRWLETNAGRFDGIVMNGIWTFPGIATRSAARRAGKPYGIFVHGALDPWFNRKYPLKHLKKLIYWPVQYKVLRDAYAVFFTTESERDLAFTSFRPNQWKSIVVPYGINDPEGMGADPAQQVEAFYEAGPAAARTPVFVVHGADPREERLAICSLKHLPGLPGKSPMLTW